VSGEFKWTIQGAKREEKKGIAKGGIWMGVKRGLEVGEEVIEEEGVIIKEIRWEGERWK